tara:strand:- start:2029 stop:2229 length:201 start_codon:yes stop_codon:yes gene_type:complete
MKFVKIETATGGDEIINVEQITSIATEVSNVVINLSDGSSVRTKFTDIDHAVDFIQRASHAFSLTL